MHDGAESGEKTSMWIDKAKECRLAYVNAVQGGDVPKRILILFIKDRVIRSRCHNPPLPVLCVLYDV